MREAIRWFREGEIVIVTDDDRENEGDLVCAATLCTPEKMAFSAEQRSSTAWALANSCARVTSSRSSRGRVAC